MALILFIQDKVVITPPFIYLCSKPHDNFILTYIMKNNILFSVCILLLSTLTYAQPTEIPWKHGPLQVSANSRYLQQADGAPFFWLGDTGWLLPEKLNRDEAAYYLEHCKQAGFNVIQVQTINGVPAMNFYGQSSHPHGYDFSGTDQPGTYGYWNHMDYIIETAERQGIYIGMVCIWGGLVKSGQMDVEQAKAYGTFLANRYKDHPNIIWIIGGDTYGNLKTEVWEALATTIKSIDKNHLMTFHPFGRTLSTTWFNNAAWLDFNMFQSGHRRYEQSKDNTNSILPIGTEEDNWRYVEISHSTKPMRPVIDGEPSYEAIPQGLHNPKEGFWQAEDVRRYAYWSVFAGAFGHTYGHNSIMQFLKPGVNAAYGATKLWYDALTDAGFNQMKYLKALILGFPFFERIPDQSIIAGENGEKYDRLIATRGTDYLLVYNYTGRSMEINIHKISGKTKKAWWYSPRNGEFSYIGEFSSKVTTFTPQGKQNNGNDWVLIVTDSAQDYVDSISKNK